MVCSVFAEKEMCLGFVNHIVENAELLKAGDLSGALACKHDRIEMTPIQKEGNKNRTSSAAVYLLSGNMDMNKLNYYRSVCFTLKLTTHSKNIITF